MGGERKGKGLEKGEEVELVMRVEDRYQRGQIRHSDLSREAALTQSSRTSLEITVAAMWAAQWSLFCTCYLYVHSNV